MKTNVADHLKIQRKIIKKLKKISRLQEEIYWLARERDRLTGYTHNHD